MDSFLMDLRIAGRSLRKRPGFTVVAVLTLALGLGANLAIFGVVDAVLLQPLPYPEADELMTLWLDNRIQGWHEDVTSYPNFMDWEEGSTTFESMAAYTLPRRNLTGDGEPERILVMQSSPDLFDVLQVDAAVGRTFEPADWETDPRVLVLSDGFWRRRLGADPDVVGRKLRLDGEPWTVVGVMDRGFAFDRPEIELWLPFAPDVEESSRNSLWLRVVGRLRDGVGPQRARADMDAVGVRLEQEWPDFNRGFGVTIVPLHEHVVGDVRTALWVLLGAVGAVLLIACANVANLSLTRAIDREGEMAVRAALGAGRRRLLRQGMVESLLTAGAGGLLGLGLAHGGMRLLQALQPELPRLAEVGVDGRVLGFAALLVLSTTVVFGLVPALRASRSDPGRALREGGRSGAGTAGGRRFRDALVVVETAMAVVLLVGAGLLLRTYQELQALDPGFEPEGLLATTVTLPAADYPDADARRLFFDELLERIGALPGVVAVGGVDSPPLGSRFASGTFTLAGQPVLPREQRKEVKFNAATPGYFEAMAIPVVSGRGFSGADGPEGLPVIVVNETFVRLFVPDGDALGEQFIFGTPDDYRTEEDPDAGPPWATLVGVVGDVRQRGLREDVEPEIFYPHAQGPPAGLTLVMRTAGKPAALAAPVREAVWQIDPDLPVSGQETMVAAVQDAAAGERLNSRLLGLFATVALLLAAVGIYGVVSYGVRQRSREIGIRMALGARAGDVFRAIVGSALLLTATGLGLGVVGALLASRLVSELLFAVEPGDPAVLAAVVAVLGMTSLVASLVPARRAVAVDPAGSLRGE